MKRLLALGVAATGALLLAATAAAHGTIRPNLVSPGSIHDFTILIPNSRTDASVVGLDVTVPKGATLVDAASGGGWRASKQGGTVTWRGGSIAPNGFDSFALRARMPARTGTEAFTGREVFSDVTGPSFPLQVVLVSGASAAQSSGGDAARTLALAALIVAIVAAALAAGAFLLALAQWLRR